MLTAWIKANIISTILVGGWIGYVIASGADANASKPVVNMFLEACVGCYVLNWAMLLITPFPCNERLANSMT